MKLYALLMSVALLAGCAFTVSERTLLHPTPSGPLPPEVLARAAPAYTQSEHWITAPDGVRLNAVLLHQPNARGTVLYFGGNGFTIGQFGGYVAEAFAPLGVDVLIVDHRGYGRSEGTPTQANLEADGVVAFDYLSGTIGVAPSRIIVHGQSLGSFIAGHVAAERPAAGVVLESSATTAEDWVNANLRGVKRALVRTRIDPSLQGRGNLPNMARIEEPMLLLVGAADRTTPPILSQRLYAASPLPPERKTLLIAPGANHVNTLRQPSAIAAYRAFVDRALAAD